MKVKISITLSETSLAEVDKLAIAPYTRSTIIEEAVQAYVANKTRRARDERELHLLNAHADEFNAEIADILSYQVEDDARWGEANCTASSGFLATIQGAHASSSS